MKDTADNFKQYFKNIFEEILKEEVTDDDIQKAEREMSIRKLKVDQLRLKKSQEELLALKDSLDAVQSPDEEKVIKQKMILKAEEIKKWKADILSDKSRNI